MKILQENMALAFKHIYWAIILIGLMIIGVTKCFAWGGFTEPIELRLHLETLDQQDPDEKRLFEMQAQSRKENEGPKNEESKNEGQSRPCRTDD